MAKVHARYSPSKLGALEKCPRFQYRETGESNDAASEGTLMHEAFEKHDLSILETEEQRAQVQKCIDYMDAIRAGMPEDCVEISEAKLDFKDYTFGYADKILFSPSSGKAHLMDAKFGRKGADDADSNMQLAMYSAGLLTGGLMVGGYHYKVVEVTAHLISPRTGEVSDFTYRPSDIDMLETRVRQVIASANNPFIPPRPYPDLCTNCAWITSCPAMNSMTTQAVQSILPGISFPGTLSVNPNATPEQKGKVLAALEVLEDAIEEGKKAIKESSLASNEPPTGYQIMTRGGSYKVTAPAVAIDLLKNSGMVSEDEVLQEAVKLSVADLIKLYVSKAQTKDDRELHRTKLLELLSPYLERGGEIKFLQRKRGFDQTKLIKGN
jgi:Protein of unknown function (DUF2800)